MAYSITPILHNYADKNSKYKIYLRLIYNRITVRVSTDYKILSTQFKDGQVIDHPNKTSINANIRNELNGIETRLIDFLRTGTPQKKDLIKIAQNPLEKVKEVKFVDFIEKHCSEMKGKKADATLDVYRSLIPDLNKYDSELSFTKIDVSWLNLYEQYQRRLKWDINTIHKKMSKIKTMLNRAEDDGLIEKKRYDKYKVPVYEQKIPEYISEDEMKAIKDLVDNIKRPVYKMAGYYFLLSCYAGYRLSDLKKFDCAKSVKGDNIILKAKKNKSIVLVPIHTRLGEILTYVKDNPINIAEQHLREYVKEIMKLAGINRRIKIHTGRHSFAMMLMDNDFEISEVATMLGISEKTAAIYARISNKRLEKKVKSRLG